MINGFLKIIENSELIDYNKSGNFYNIDWGIRYNPKNAIPPFWYEQGDNSTPTDFKAVKMERTNGKWVQSSTEVDLDETEINLIGENYVHFGNYTLGSDLDTGIYQLKITDGSIILYSEPFCVIDENTSFTGSAFSSGFSGGFS